MPDREDLDLRPACLNLRHKMMYCDERQARPGQVDGRSATRVFFCVKTGDCLGPDGTDVAPESCTRSRGCFCDGRGGIA